MEKVRELSIQSNESFPVETIEDCEIIYSDSAQVRVILNANELNRYVSERPFLEFNNGVRVQFFNAKGKKESELNSDYAKLDEENNLMIAKNNVKVRNIDGDILESDELIWNQEKKEIYSDEFVKITTSHEVIYGNGFVSNQNFTKYTIKNIKGTILVDNQ
jgi:LPS export ABC transporter protein LptC